MTGRQDQINQMHGCLYQEGLNSMMLGVSWDVDT